jgi:hypothetical protein
MIEYVTTNIRLPKAMYKELKQLAVKEEKSVAQVIRESVAQYLVAAPRTVDEGSDRRMLEAWQSDPLWSIGGDPVVADVTDGSLKHDDYLYGPLAESARAELRDE